MNGHVEAETKILDGRVVSRELKEEIGEQVAALRGEGGRAPGLAVVLVGENPASQVYVGSKERSAAKAGFVSRVVRKPADITQAELEQVVEELNHDDTIDGFLVQLPLPDGLDSDRILELIDPTKDVDGFHPMNMGRLWLDQGGFAPATPSGIIELLKRSDVPLEGMNAVIVGRSRIVGKPMAGLLLRENCTVTLAHSRTRDLPGVCRSADLLIAAIGAPALFGPEHVSPGAVVVDVGINRVEDRDQLDQLFPGDEKRLRGFEERGYFLIGDVDYTRVAPIAGAITPVPGGVGPLTVTMLLANTLLSARRRQGLE
jgi:methylenetetrahydrofolate dehydrogenase (NADP+)/methenyltetrahydrofolate cyclohydrolase